jgi:acyl dehydratase
MKPSPLFDAVPIGLELPMLEKGPLGPVHLMRWSAAMENWHRIHYDHAFATGHDGLPDLLINGSLKQQFIAQLLRDWAGDAGWVWKVGFRFRAMNTVGQTLRVWARVTERQRLARYGLVRLELGVIDEDGRESTPGWAEVALPLSADAPVPYPFTPPATGQPQPLPLH